MNKKNCPVFRSCPLWWFWSEWWWFLSCIHTIIIFCTRTCIVNDLKHWTRSSHNLICTSTNCCSRFGPSSVDFWQLYVESPGTGSTFCSDFQMLSSPVLSRLCSVLSCQCPVLSVQCPSSTSIPVYPVNPVLSVHPVQYIQYIRYISSTFLQVFIR